MPIDDDVHDRQAAGWWDEDDPLDLLHGSMTPARSGYVTDVLQRFGRAPPGHHIEAAVLREPAATLPQVRRISTYDPEPDRPTVAVNEALGLRRAGGPSTWSRRI